MFIHALTFASSRGSCLNLRPPGRELKHLSRDPANVNTMKQTCMIIIPAYLLISLSNRIENAVKLLKFLYLYVESFCRKWCQLANSKVNRSFLLTMLTQQTLR